MPLMAEIADKMPTIAGMWCVQALIAAAAFGVVIISRGIVCSLAFGVTLLFAAKLTYGSYHQAWLEHDFSDAVWDELGSAWVTSSLATPWLPFGAVLVALVVRSIRAQSTVAEVGSSVE